MAVMLDQDDLAATQTPPGLDDTAPRTSKPKTRPADRTPKASTGRRAGRPSAAAGRDSETKRMGEALGQLLSMPGVIFGMVGEPYLAAHFAGVPMPDPANPTQALVIDGEVQMVPGAGHRFGMQLAKASETNPKLRDLIRKAMTGDSFATLILGAIAYAAPPLVYMLTPNTSPLRRTFGVPPRSQNAAPPVEPATPAQDEADPPGGER